MTLPNALALAERASTEVLQQQVDFILRFIKLTDLLDAVSTFVLVVNEQRQIVYANRSFRDYLNLGKDLTDFNELLGQRPGEVLRCTHSNESPGGCGTTAACKFCGTLHVLLASQAGEKTVKECCIWRQTCGVPEALEMRVSASPLTLGEEQFSILDIVDISNEKRKRALERLFFHDVLNAAGGLLGLANTLNDLELKDKEARSLCELLCVGAEQLMDEISAQQILTTAENNQLKAEVSELEMLPFLEALAKGYMRHQVAQGRSIQVAEDAQDLRVETDERLLRRVVLNLLKNALEACKKGEIATLNVRQVGTDIHISVHNPGVMPEDVRAHIFNRSFSTRGSGRGLGTYSVKLFTEGALRGKVWFDSEPARGTVFTVMLPARWM